MSQASRDELHAALRCEVKELRRENQALRSRLATTLGDERSQIISPVHDTQEERQRHVADRMTSTSSLALQITINGLIEHLRGTALGFRNLTNYITRSLLDTGGFRPRPHPICDEPLCRDPG